MSDVFWILKSDGTCDWLWSKCKVSQQTYKVLYIGKKLTFENVAVLVWFKWKNVNCLLQKLRLVFSNVIRDSHKISAT